MVTNRRLQASTIPDSDKHFTPSWATHSLLQKEAFHGLIWEPSCGNGWISNVLKSYNYRVRSSDIDIVNKYGAPGIDFLRSHFQVANIITNPPYSILNKFMEHGIQLARKKFCLLVRLAALATKDRWSLIYNDQPPSRIWVFVERVTMYPYGIKTGGSGTTEYAWFVWDKESSDIGKLGWIEPGNRARYSNNNNKHPCINI